MNAPTRLAVIVSHPIQYYVPLYRRLAARDDFIVKVFFTWHAAQAPVFDPGFKIPVAWDIPLTQGYEFELIANVSPVPSANHFLGLINPALTARVAAWRPDVVHVTGWTPVSHLLALRFFHRKRIATLFRGDSHLLDEDRRGPRWQLKQTVLRRVFSWPDGFLVVGAANRAYYEAFGVEERRLYPCPHSVEVERFAEPKEAYEQEAARWREQLGIPQGRCVLLFAGKFEPRKRPLELMRAFEAAADPGAFLLMVGNGELEQEVNAIAAKHPSRFRVLPFQNQSRMPLVYRLGDLFVLPSAYGETWGLAVNEALACGRPVLVSDRVGCAADVVNASCGRVFSWSEPEGLTRALRELSADRSGLLAMQPPAEKRAWFFDVKQTEASLAAAVTQLRERLHA